MKKKILATIAGLMIGISSITSTVFADEYTFDTSKARQTYGGGQSFTSFTRLDNEKRDAKKFDPRWITSESSLEVTFTTSGEYKAAPLNLILQSWVGDKVDATEDKWVLVEPSEFTDTSAIFTYDDIVKVYGEDLSDIYAINIGDQDNELLVTSFVVHNCDIPEDVDITDLVGGSAERTEEAAPAEEVTEAETSVQETEAVSEETEQSETIAETDATDATTEIVEINNDTPSAVSEETSPVEDSFSRNSTLLIVIIASAVVIVVLIIILVVLVSKNKKKNRLQRFK